MKQWKYLCYIASFIIQLLWCLYLPWETFCDWRWRCYSSPCVDLKHRCNCNNIMVRWIKLVWDMNELMNILYDTQTATFHMTYNQLLFMWQTTVPFYVTHNILHFYVTHNSCFTCDTQQFLIMWHITSAFYVTYKFLLCYTLQFLFMWHTTVPFYVPQNSSFLCDTQQFLFVWHITGAFYVTYNSSFYVTHNSSLLCDTQQSLSCDTQPFPF